jgi:hypothetical protein
VTYNEIIRLSGILDEAQTTIPPYERPKIAKSCSEAGFRRSAPQCLRQRTYDLTIQRPRSARRSLTANFRQDLTLKILLVG